MKFFCAMLCLLLMSPAASARLAEAQIRPAGSTGTGKTRVIRLSRPAEGHCTTPRISPDGTAVAYELRNDTLKTRGLIVRDLSSGGEREVHMPDAGASSLLARFNNFSLQTFRDFAWTPAGPFRAAHPWVFVGTRNREPAALYLAGLGRLTTARATEGHPAWSSDGRHLAFVSSLSGEGDLYLFDTHFPKEAPIRLTTSEEEAELFPSWDPAGGRLCFVRHSARGDNLILLDIRGSALWGERSNLTQTSVSPRSAARNSVEQPPTARKSIERPLTTWTSTQTHPSWSPDGRTLAFFSNHRHAEQFDLWIMPAPSRDSEAFAPAANALRPKLLAKDVVLPDRSGPAWRPDSRAIIVALNRPAQLDPLAEVAVADGKITLLGSATVHNESPAVGIRNGKPYLVFSAQGARDGEGGEMWRKIYGGPLDALRKGATD